MLQRAASNAYSWWWASHIRTKQSKWLDNDLQEMEERVKSMIRLIEEDADSFAKKAEMYYRRRPELINFVEESYKAYKALADRYDRISGELHKANHTIATAFPDQVQMMEDEDDDSSPKAISSIKSTKLLNPPPDFTKFPKPPAELPRISSRNKAREDQFAPKKPHHRRVTSQISRDKAQDEIDRLQKGILVFQTEKEFFKRSYESGLAKYWDIERKMTEMQEEVSQLQDEFSASSVIEDDEARALMAATALKSCEDTLFSLQEQQKRSMEEARLESQRIKVAKEKLKALKGEKDTVEISDKDIAVSSTCMEEVGSLKHERLELKSICEKVKEHFEMSSDSSVVELAEKIEELVDKVISLELTVSSQTAQIKRLSSDTDSLQKHLRGLEEDKMNLPDNSNSSSERLKQVEEELQIIQDLERSVQHEKGILRSHFTEACDSLNDLSEKLQSPKQKGQVSFKGEAEISVPNIETLEESKDVKDKKIQKTKENLIEEVYSKEISNSEKIQEEQNDDGMDQGGELKSQVEEDEDSPDWQQLLLNGLEGKEKILLYEYTSILRNYKETKNRLTEIEKKNQECHSETMQQIQELRSDNAIKDEEIKTLRQKVFSSTSLHSSSIKRPKSQEPSNPKNTQKLEDLIVAKPDKAFEVSDTRSPLAEEEVKLCQIDQQHTSSAEEKFRADIDTLLEENLDFWLRFSTSYHQIRKFQSTFKELQAEIEKLSEIKNQDGSRGNIGSASVEQAAMPDSSPTDKKLRELNTKLQVWLEQNGLLKGELQCRFASLCSIQEDILKVSKASEGEEVQFTPYQAAKFQGEVINMQQENNKVAKELQDGLDHVRGLQVEVGRALSKLHESFELSGSRGRNHYHPLRLLSTKTRIPLRTFLFGVKPKKPSIFSCMNPALHKQYSDLRAGGFPT